MSIIRFTTIVLMMFCTVSCALKPKGEPAPVLSFEHLKAVAIDVVQIETRHSFTGPVDGFVAEPEVLMERYIANRFEAVGGANSLELTIEDASVVHRDIEAKHGVAKFLDIGGAAHYDVRLKLRIEHLDERGGVIYGRILEGVRRVKVSEHLSIVERESAQLHALEALFDELDERIMKIVRDEMKLVPGRFSAFGGLDMGVGVNIGVGF